MRACLNDRLARVVRDTQVARDGQLRATADRGAGEGGQDGHGEGGDRVADLAPDVGESPRVVRRRRRPQLAQVAPRGERVPGAGEDHRAQPCVRPGRVERPDERRERRRVERVLRLRPREREDGDVSTALDRERPSAPSLTPSR